MTPRRLSVVLIVVLGAFVCAPRGEAHKPITSPYTFTEHVLPILRDHCGRCHASGSVAPMSLLTYEETIPWAESMRMELVAGHMPPWGLETPSSKFRNAGQMTARELNLLLTWAAGGTPRGSDAPPSVAIGPDRVWRLGTPDLQLQPAAEFTLAADVQQRTEEFTLATGTPGPRWVRAVDLMPGAPAIVRGATISVKSDSAGAAAASGSPERVLALWLPGDDPVPLDDGAGFLLPAGAELTLRIHYRKTWQHERDTIRDRSVVGLYFTSGKATDVRTIALAPSPDEATAARSAGRLSFTRVLDDEVTAIAIYPDSALHDVDVDVHALRPDGGREALIAFRPQEHWTRRYWYREPVVLPRGTRLEVKIGFGDETAWLPPGTTPRPPTDPSDARLMLNVISK